jgi:hypothetical protein
VQAAAQYAAAVAEGGSLDLAGACSLVRELADRHAGPDATAR